MLKTFSDSAEVGAIVARFQVPELHEEHKALIQRVASTHPRTLVILGLAADVCKCTYNNPLDFAARKAMVESEFPEVEVLYIRDTGVDETWSAELDRIISSQIGPGQRVVLYGGRDSFIPHYKGRYGVQELVPNKFISGKEVRKNVGIKSKNTKEFREGVVWAVENQWPQALPTVDVAIVDTKENRVLLGRKPNNKLIRFVGGFAKPESESFEEDAAREVQEETGLVCNNLKYIRSVRIDDWRFRSERNKIKTTFFWAEYEGGTPIANDDLAEVEWFAIDKLNEEMFVREHRVLLKLFMEKVVPQLTK